MQNPVSHYQSFDQMLTFGLGIIILQGVSSRKSLAGVNIMDDFIAREKKMNAENGEDYRTSAIALLINIYF
jgi:hypothetical protein